MTIAPSDEWIRTDFNGILEQDMLCLAHKDVVTDQAGRPIALRAGLSVTAFDDDEDEHGRPDPLIASGIVEPSPAWAACRGSRWVLRVDAAGFRHLSDTQTGRAE